MSQNEIYLNMIIFRVKWYKLSAIASTDPLAGLLKISKIITNHLNCTNCAVRIICTDFF